MLKCVQNLCDKMNQTLRRIALNGVNMETKLFLKIWLRVQKLEPSSVS